MKKELGENEKLLNNHLYKLKIKYENEIKLCKSNYKIVNENIKKKFKKLNDNYNKAFNEELDNLEKEYSYNVSNLEYNKKIDFHKNLSLIIQILKNKQENYPDNYYNNNINNIIYKYYESKDESIQKILTKDV